MTSPQCISIRRSPPAILVKSVVAFARGNYQERTNEKKAQGMNIIEDPPCQREANESLN